VAGVIQVVGLGAGGHAKVVVEILHLREDYQLVGLLDPREELWGTKTGETVVLGGDDLLSELFAKGVHHAFIGLGSVGNTSPRQILFDRACGQGFSIVSAIHPQAIIAPSALIGAGATLGAGSVLNTNAKLGDNVIINTGAIVEHDCFIGDHAHIATGARLAGEVYVGPGAHIGIGASIRNGIRIGREAIVGAGAAVVSDVPANAVVTGVPARVMKVNS
jgi:UDP-perosamine 4-acetyltransferase